MWPYLLLLFGSGWMALTHMRPLPALAPPSREWAWPAFFVILTLMIGLRHEIGADWGNYLLYLDRIEGESLKAILRDDPAYELLNWIGANVGGGIYFVNTLCAGLFCWGLLAFCRIQPRAWLALLVAIPYLVLVVAMGYSRQGVAIGLAMLALTRLSSGNVIPFIFWIALAASFHKSAVILTPFALFAGTRTRLLTLVGVLVTTALLFALLLKEHLDGLLLTYLGAEYESSGAAIRIAINAIPAALFLLFRKRFAFDSRISAFWAWMSLTALLFIPLLILSPSSTAIDRVALYWLPLQLVVLSRLPDVLGVPGKRNPLWVYAISSYSALIMIVWLVFAHHAHAWLPYRFYPWVALWA